MRDDERDGGAPKAMADGEGVLGARPTVGTGRGGARGGCSAGDVASGGGIGVGIVNGINEMEVMGRLGVIIGIGGMLIIRSVGIKIASLRAAMRGVEIHQLGEKHCAESTPQWVWEVFASEEGILNQEQLQ